MSHHRYACGVVAVVLSMCLVTTSVGAQTTATMAGHVQDESRGALPGALVAIRNVDSGLTRSATTDAEGRFTLAALPVGTYEVRVTLQGFRPLVQSGVVASVNEMVALVLTMVIGGVTEELTVVASQAGVNTVTPELSYLVAEKPIESLPLNGRNYSDLALLQPGVLAYPSRDGGSVVAHGLGMSINGQHYRMNVYLLDGTLQNDFTNGPAGSAAGTALGTETIREFRVEANAYGAEFGRGFGGQVNVLTKSGGSTTRGSAFGFYRDDALDAPNYFDVGGKPPFRRNQFGATLGGPIQRDRLFYFGSFEGLRESLGRTISSFVPDDAARQGVLPDGLVTIDSAIRPYLDAIPRANGSSIGSGLASYVFRFDQKLNEGFAQGRVDYNAGPRHQFFARYTVDDADQRLPTDYPAFPRSFLSTNQFVTAEYRNIFSDRTLGSARFGFSRTRVGQNVQSTLDSPLPAFVSTRDLVGDIDIGGMQRFGPQSSANLRLRQNVVSAQLDVTHTRARHLLKTGVLVEHYADSMTNPTFSLGIYAFSNVRAFLENRPLRFVGLTPQGAIDRNWPFTLFALYGQDTFQVSPRVTLTGGLRYETSTLPVDTEGRDSALVQLTDSAPTIGRLYQNPTLKNVSPRVGAAWDVFGTGTTSVRGGYGLYFNTTNQQTLIITVTNPPATPRVIIANPTFPAPPFERGVGTTIRPVQWDLDSPRLHSWNASVEQRLRGQFVATIAYAGARGVHLLRDSDVNVPTPTVQANGRLLFPPAGTPRPNPNFSTIELTSSDGDSWYRALVVELRRRWHNGISAQSSYTWSKAEDTTQAATFFSDATNGTTTAFPEFGTDYNKGPSDWDARHNWVANIIWDLPLGRGKSGAVAAWLNGWQVSAIANLRSGQPLTVFVQANRSRSLWSPSIAPTSGLDRADLAPGRTAENAVLGLPDRWFDPRAFQLQPAGTLGNSGRGAFRGPNLREIDFAVVKTVTLGGRARAEIRLETFNLLNRANFGTPTLIAFAGTSDGEQPLATFGRIRSTVTSARQTQLGVRIAF